MHRSVQNTNSSRKNLINPHLIQLLRRNMSLHTFFILQHEIIAIDDTITTVHNSALSHLPRPSVPAKNRLVEEVNRFITQVAVEFNSCFISRLVAQGFESDSEQRLL